MNKTTHYDIDMRAYDKNHMVTKKIIRDIFSFCLGFVLVYLSIKGIACSFSQQKNIKGVSTNQKRIIEPIIYHHPIIDQINKERTGLGLPTVKINPILMIGAYARAKDLKQRNQWSHDGYRMAFTSSGYSGYRIGENLARNYGNDIVVSKWMQSPDHKRNILTKEFDEVGMGIYENYTVLWFGAARKIKAKKPSWKGYVSYYSRAGCLGCSKNLIMANGEPLDDSRSTIAFNWLPMNTKVRITNLNNGRVTVAVVADTGGFNSLNRIADLTLAVANELETKTDISLVLIEQL